MITKIIIKNGVFTLILLQLFVCTQAKNFPSNQKNCTSKEVISKNTPKPSPITPKQSKVDDFDLKNIERLMNITIPSDIKKYYSEINTVDGWFDKKNIVILLLIDLFQSKNGITGNLGEIGVWQGKSFIPLILLAKNNESAVAVDCFELSEFNRDKSGGNCNFEIFSKNVKKYCSRADKLIVIKGDSIKFTATDYLSKVRNGKGFRIFSIDGCHEAPSTIKDLENAFKCLADGGIIMVDDYFHWCWPGVSEGVNFFMNNNSNCLKPFLIAWNKIFFAQPVYAQKYFTIIKEFLIPQDVRIKKFFGVDTLVYDKQG